MSKIKVEEIQEILANNKWKLISESYENLDSELIYECAEGHRVFGPWKKFRKNPICPQCAESSKLSDAKFVPKSSGTYRVLALDQATHTSGWAIFDNQKLVKYGIFETTLKEEIERCDQIRSWLISMIKNWRPDFIAFEDIQFQEQSDGRRMGVTVFQSLAHLQGILMETAFENKVQFCLCPTNTWRHECGVKGRTRTDKKRSMQLLAKQWYDVTITEDEADAIGIGKYASQHHKPIIVENWE